jgi:large subunit ribosomal protein L25
MHIPVKVTGNSQGVLKGGRFIQKLRKLKIKALPVDLPDNVVVDITPLEINDSIKVSDIKKDKVTFLDAPTAVIVGVRVTRVIVEEAPAAAEGAAAPAEGAAAPATGEKGKEAEKGKEKK